MARWTELDIRLLEAHASRHSAGWIRDNILPHRSLLSVKRQAQKIRVTFPVKIDLTGAVIGQLTVLEYVASVAYGGRLQPQWRCRCNCGNELLLVSDQLPTTKAQRTKMNNGGRRLYDCCDECRQKSCLVCGNKFSYSHTSHVCSNPECQEQLRQERDAFWKSIFQYRLQTDADFHAAHLQKKRKRHQRNAASINESRRAHYQALPEAEKEKIRQRHRTYYQALKADPDRYQRWLESRRRWRTEQQLKTMLADAQKLQQLFESEME